MSKLLNAIEDVVGDLISYIDYLTDVGCGSTARTAQAQLDTLRDAIKHEKETVMVGRHEITNAVLYNRIINKMSTNMFGEYAKSVENDLDKENPLQMAIDEYVGVGGVECPVVP